MKTRTKIILALPLALATYFGIDCYLYERRVVAKEKKTYDDQVGFYKRFLKPGMTRVAVEQELKLRSIPVLQRLQRPAALDLVLLERFGSPKSYCSFEDVSLRLDFEPADNATTYEGNHFNGKPDDRLRAMSVYRQLMDCL
ncbi:MAG TPA: hypothetical protein VNU92_14415 [Edaphobacter sp.]|nr:hypothetical protein [Edaphobacter sp.]